MKALLPKTIVTIVAALSLSACAESQLRVAQPAPRTVEAVSEEGFQDWAVVINGQPIAQLLRDRAKARAILDEALGQRFEDEQLAEFLARLKQDDVREADVPEGLRGVAGFTTAQLLEAVLASADQEQKVSGKIRKYYFNDNENSGYLEVDTKVETLQGGSVVQTDTYFWAVAVRPGTYQIINRDDSSPNDPFPNTVTFPPEALDPNNPNSIWARRLDQKLWGKGTGIVVVGIIKNGALLPTSHPWYTSTAASCIDLMFWGYPPENELPPQMAYCLGRCDQPQIVNTR